MTRNIYRKTFIRESEAAITKIDDALSYVEEGIGELNILLRKLTKGNTDTLDEQSKTETSDYQDRINRMDRMLTDLYSYKNDLLDDLENMK